jgi:ketosteroid isomerase-like protein
VVSFADSVTNHQETQGVRVDDVREWLDRLKIRDVIERYMRYNDDGDAERLTSLFHEDATFQTAGQTHHGRDAIGALFRGAFSDVPPGRWTDEGNLFAQPRSLHIGSNPVIDLDGDRATAETDFQVMIRNAEGRAALSLIGRFRDRMRRGGDGAWLIECRTIVSVARQTGEVH